MSTSPLRRGQEISHRKPFFAIAQPDHPPFPADFRCSRRQCREAAWNDQPLVVISINSVPSGTMIAMGLPQLKPPSCGLQKPSAYRAPHSTTPSSAKTDPPAKSSAPLASHEGLSSSLWVMIATLTTKSAHHPMIRSSVQAIGANVFWLASTQPPARRWSRHAGRLIRTCGGKSGQRHPIPRRAQALQEATTAAERGRRGGIDAEWLAPPRRLGVSLFFESTTRANLGLLEIGSHCARASGLAAPWHPARRRPDTHRRRAGPCD